MNVSTTGLVNTSTKMQQRKVAESAQVLVLKNAMDIEASAALALLTADPGNLPLASSEDLGSQVNTTA
jgi:hypothetical protein